MLRSQTELLLRACVLGEVVNPQGTGCDQCAAGFYSLDTATLGAVCQARARARGMGGPGRLASSLAESSRV